MDGDARRAAEDGRFCRRCLLSEFQDGVKLQALIQEVIAALPQEERADEHSYSARLTACRRCDNLISGMCILCGCYVEARAAKARMYCPDTVDRWTGQ